MPRGQRAAIERGQEFINQLRQATHGHPNTILWEAESLLAKVEAHFKEGSDA